MPTAETTITRDGEDWDVTVEYTAAPFTPAQTYGPPENCSPAEGGEIEIIRTVSGDTPLVLTPEEEAKLEEWLFEHCGEDDPDDYDDEPDYDDDY